VQIVDGEITASWIKASLPRGLGPVVTEQVPSCYSSFVRIFHPAFDQQGHLIRWSRVAAEYGKVVHPEMQWNSISTDARSGGCSGLRWDGAKPSIAGMSFSLWASVSRILMQNTLSVDTFYYGLSTIHSDVADSFQDAVPFVFGDRAFVICRLSRTELECEADREKASLLPPNILWPADKSWYLASEYDFDSTLIGGSEAIVRSMMSNAALEALEIGPEASLAADADRLNC
jgi:hypothetical protein